MTNKLVFMASFLILTSVIILMTSQGSSGGSPPPPACAVCKHQRRRCTPDCLFRPYFPQSESEAFLKAHRLFGVRTMVKILENLSPEIRDDAMKSIIYESEIRSRFPVEGCSKIIGDLLSQIALRSAKLLNVQSQIATFTSATAAVYDPGAAFFNPAAAAVESLSSESRNPSPNVTAGNDYVTGVPVSEDGTIDFFSRQGRFGNFAYGECVTGTRPLERINNAQQCPPDFNNLGSSPATENNANDNDKNAFDSDASLQAFQQYGGAPNNNDNRRQFDFCTDEQRSFPETKESGDQCADQSTMKDDGFPFP